MSVERYTDMVTKFRLEHPNCHYCISNKNYFAEGKVARCLAKCMDCWNPEKIAKKCSLFRPRYFEEEEIVFWI